MRRIFIGSSTEALSKVTTISKILRRTFKNEIEVIEWSKAFEPGFVPMETIQKIAHSVTGALLLATPDDKSSVRSQKIFVPRTNVMLELGYFAAILGRSRTAMCKYSEVTLPTDLNGVIPIDMGEYPGNSSNQVASVSIEQIIKWVRSLHHHIPGMPSVELLHAYSGRWKWTSSFKKWFDLEFIRPDHAWSEGYWDLIIPLNGKNGIGSCLADVYIKTNDWYLHFKNSERISSINLNDSGTMTFEIEFHDRHIIKQDGNLPNLERLVNFVGASKAAMRFEPNNDNIVELTGIRENEKQGIFQSLTAFKQPL